MSLILLTSALSIEYDQVQGDSIFVMGVRWFDIHDTTYSALIDVDLNYNQYANPLTQFAFVERYIFNNWWNEDLQFAVGEMAAILDSDGNVVTYPRLDYYWELPDSSMDPSEMCVVGTTKVECGDVVPSTRQGYYGLPFYIKRVEFICDVTDESKGKKVYVPDLTQKSFVHLTRIDYEGIEAPILNVETAVVPLGFVTDAGRVARWTGKVDCYRMDTTTNTRLMIILKPNPLYRHVDPAIVGSETWEYADIISSLSSVTNTNELPFALDIDFDFSGNFWDYRVNTSVFDATVNNLFGDPSEYELNCVVTSSTSGYRTNLKYSELSTDQKLNVNTGELACSGTIGIFGSCSDGSWGIISCLPPVSPGIEETDDTLYEDFTETISVDRQREIVAQLDNVNKKLATKEFVSKSIIPFFAVIIIFVFYLFSLAALGITAIGLLPLMFTQFIEGLKDAFDIEPLLKQMRKKR